MDKCAGSPYVLDANATAPPTRATRDYYATLLGLQLASLALLTLHFRRTKNAFERTRVRRTAVLVLYGTSLAVGVGGGVFLPFVVGIDRFPCWLTHLLCLTLVPMMFVGSMFRNANFALRTRWARLASFLRAPTSIRHLDDDDAAWINDVPPPSAMQNLVYSLSALLSKDHDVPQSDLPRLRSALLFLKTKRGLLVFVTVTLAPLTLVNFLVVFVNNPHFACTGCVPLQHYPIILTMCAEALPSFVFALVVAERFSRVPDPWVFFRVEARLVGVFILFGLVALIVLAAVPPNDPTTGIFTTPNTAILALVASTLAFASMSSLPFLTAVVNAEPRKGGRHRVAAVPRPKGQSPAATVSKSATSGGAKRASLAPPPNSPPMLGSGDILDGIVGVPKLAAVLASPDDATALGNQLAAEWGQEALWFLEDAAQYRATFHDVSPPTRLARARKICRTYLDRGAMSEVNISASQRAAVVAHVAAAEADASRVSREAFDDVRQELAWVLENGAVTRLKAGSAIS